MVAKFAAKTTNSEKATYFLSLIPCSINKLKSHMLFTCKSFRWKKNFAPGNGRGLRSLDFLKINLLVIIDFST